MEQTTPLTPTSRLALLPRELSDRIYEFALAPRTGPVLTPSAPPRDPALTRVSRFLRAETLPIAYRRVTLHLARNPVPPPLPPPPANKNAAAADDDDGPWSVEKWIARRGGAERLAHTRVLRLVLDEESGYSSDALAAREFADSAWAAAIPALLDTLQRGGSGGGPRLRRLVVEVRGKKKCAASHSDNELETPGLMAHRVYFADCAGFYADFFAALGPRLADVARGVEFSGIFPAVRVLQPLWGGRVVAVVQDWTGFLQECALYSRCTPEKLGVQMLAELEKEYKDSKGNVPEIWEKKLRHLHNCLEYHWKNEIVAAYLQPGSRWDSLYSNDPYTT